MQPHTHTQPPADNQAAGVKLTWIDRLVDWYVHDWQGIPRAVAGPLTAPKTEKPKTKEVPIVRQNSVYVINEHTKTFGFRMDHKVATGKNQSVTQYDQYYLDKRGLKNASLNQLAKARWAQEMTAAAAAADLKVSESYVQKIFACFSRGEQEEKSELQKVAKK